MQGSVVMNCYGIVLVSQGLFWMQNDRLLKKLNRNVLLRVISGFQLLNIMFVSFMNFFLVVMFLVIVLSQFMLRQVFFIFVKVEVIRIVVNLYSLMFIFRVLVVLGFFLMEWIFNLKGVLNRIYQEMMVIVMVIIIIGFSELLNVFFQSGLILIVLGI